MSESMGAASRKMQLPAAQPQASASGTGGIAPANTLSDEEKDRKQADAKLHPALQSALACWESAKASGTTGSCGLVQQGRVQVEITLNRKTNLAELQKLGFVRIRESADGKTVSGNIAVETLRELAALDSVRYVAPGPLGRR